MKLRDIEPALREIKEAQLLAEQQLSCASGLGEVSMAVEYSQRYQLILAVLNRMQPANAIPMGAMKRKINMMEAADACDQSIDRELLRALQTVLQWARTADYKNVVERMHCDA